MDRNSTTPKECKEMSKTSPKSLIKVSISSMRDMKPKSSKIVSKNNAKESNSCSSCNANVPTGKYFFRAMFCLLAVLIYLRLLVCKKGFLCSCPVERKVYCLSV